MLSSRSTIVHTVVPFAAVLLNAGLATALHSQPTTRVAQAPAVAARDASPAPIAGTYTLIAVDEQPLAAVVWRDQRGWTTHFTAGTVRITGTGAFVDETHTESERGVGASSEGMGSASVADGRTSLVGDTLWFAPAAGGGAPYAMRVVRAEDAIRLVQAFGGHLLTYARVADRPARSLARGAPVVHRAPRTPPALRLGQTPVMAGGTDRLSGMVRGLPGDTGSVALPAMLAAQIRSVLPTFRLRRSDELMNASTGVPDGSAIRASMAAVVVVDLDGDRLPEALLLGTLADDDSMDVVLGVRQTASGFEIRELRRAPVDPSVTWSVARLDARGREASRGHGATWWATLQEPDCKGAGFRWTVRGGRWTRVGSDCSYGE